MGLIRSQEQGFSLEDWTVLTNWRVYKRFSILLRGQKREH